MKRSVSFWLALVLILIAVGGVGYSYYQTTLEQGGRQALLETGQVPVAVLDRTELDWGVIPRSPAVTEDFVLSNTGSAPLEVKLVTTSCSCTTAELMSGGKVLSVPVSIEPSKSVTVRVVFDPDAHDSRGLTRRAVRIETNDPVNPFLIINLLADVQ